MSHRRDFLYAVALIATTFLVYFPAWHGEPLLDDAERFITTPQLRSLHGLATLWFQPSTNRQYHPIVDTVYWLEDKLWGEQVLGYHLVTIFCHALSAVLLAKILKKLQVPGAWLAAAIFALHPVQTESVAWMIELKNTLSAVFFFGAILAYLRFDQKRSRGSYASVVVLFVAGILVKAIVATLPAVLLILIWWKRGEIRKRDFLPLLPLGVLAAGVGLLSEWMERAFVGAEGADFTLSIIERVLIAGRAFWFYIGKIFWPVDLVLMYPRWKIDATVWWQYLFPTAAIALFVLAWVRRNQWRWFWASLLFFTVTIGPLLGFFNVGFFQFSFVADHFQYLPSLGVIVPIAAGATLVMQRAGRWSAQLETAFCAILLLVLASLTWKQSYTYRNKEVSYRTVLSKSPDNWNAHYRVGAELLKHGDTRAAAAEFREVIALQPNNPLAAKRAHVGLGSILVVNRDLNGALAEFDEALRVYPTDASAHDGKASALHRQGRLSEAIAEYQRALQLRPDSPVIMSNLAWMLATCSDSSLRNGQNALQLAQRANEITRGSDPKVLRSLAAAFAETGQFGKAAEAAQHALELSVQDGETPFRHALRREIDLFKSGVPYHETGR